MSNDNFILLKQQFHKKINPKVISNIDQNQLYIQEPNPKAKGRGIKINNISNALTMHLDEKNRKIYFIKGETKINDATIFYVNNSTLFVILIELKSNTLRKYKEQILYGKFYCDFILNVLLQDEPNIQFNYIEYRGFVFTTGRISEEKRTTRRGLIFNEYENNIYYKTLENNKEYNFNQLVEPIL